MAPYCFHWGLFPNAVSELNINEKADISLFKRKFTDLSSSMDKELKLMEKNTFDYDCFYRSLMYARNEKPTSKIVEIVNESKVSLKGHFLFYVLFSNSVFSVCCDMYCDKPNLYANVMEYGLKNGFIHKNKLIERTMKLKQERDKQRLMKVLTLTFNK